MNRISIDAFEKRDKHGLPSGWDVHLRLGDGTGSGYRAEDVTDLRSAVNDLLDLLQNEMSRMVMELEPPPSPAPITRVPEALAAAAMEVERIDRMYALDD